MEIDDKLEIEVGTSLFKFDGPIGRFRYFVIRAVIESILLLVLFFKDFLIYFIRICPVNIYYFLAGLLLIGLWINFVAVSKRLYDITGSLKQGIIFGFLLCFIIVPMFKSITLLLLIGLIFVPGKLIKNYY